MLRKSHRSSSWERSKKVQEEKKHKANGVLGCKIERR
jgi:hypothetical protein